MSDDVKIKRGRKAKVDEEVQKSIYREFSTELIKNGELQPASSNIYEVLSKKLQMSAKAIRLSVIKFSKEIFDVEYKKTEYRDEKVENNSDSEFDAELFSKDDDGVTLSIHLFEADRFSFDFITVQGLKRNYLTLRPGWTDKLFAIIVRETKSECCYSFKKVYVIGNEFKTKAHCTECGGTLFVMSQQNRSKLAVQIVNGEFQHTNTKRRRLASDTAADLINQLNKDTVHNVHMKLVNDLDEDLEKLPRDFIDHKSLENLKYRNNAQRDSAITELRKMKYLPHYASAIKEVCCDPFKLMFWTKEQLFCFCQLKKKQRVVLSFDATGGLISRASITQDVNKFFEKPLEIPHIFLYSLCMKNIHGTSVPIGQMLSASQDSVTISYFLNMWTNQFCIPNEFIIDDSKALQKAILLSCTRFRKMTDYLTTCFAILDGNEIKPPECYIRLDIPHFIRTLSRDKVFENVDKRLKHYYMSIFGVLIQCEDYNAVKKIVKNTLMLANYPIFGKWKGSILPSGEALKHMNATIQTHDLQFMENSDIKPDNTEEIETDPVKWFDDMLDSVNSSLKANGIDSKLDTKYCETNWYYFPKITQFLRCQLERLPLWSPVMRIHFGATHLTGISTDIESRFQVLKNNVFKNTNLPCRADIFVKKYMDEVSGVSRLNRLMLPSRDENNNSQQSVNDGKAGESVDEAALIANAMVNQVKAVDKNSIYYLMPSIIFFCYRKTIRCSIWICLQIGHG